MEDTDYPVSDPISETNEAEPNWQREALTQWWQPSRQLLKAIRSYQRCKQKGGPMGKILGAIRIAEYRFWSVVCGCDIPITARIGGGLLLPHPTGVVIHPKAVIGVNCCIFQQVTIVSKVTVGNHVMIGAGAKILGHTTLENGAKVGANAVVKKMVVPAGSLAVGIPARIVSPKTDDSTSETLANSQT